MDRARSVRAVLGLAAIAVLSAEALWVVPDVQSSVFKVDIRPTQLGGFADSQTGSTEYEDDIRQPVQALILAAASEYRVNFFGSITIGRRVIILAQR